MLDGLTKTAAKYSATMGQMLQNLNDKIHGKLGYERKIVISEHKIYVRYKKKGHTGKYSGKSDFYSNGELYLKGYANPIKIQTKEAEPDENGNVPTEVRTAANVDLDLVSSQKYRNAVKNKIVTQALNTPSDDYELVEKLLMGLIGCIIFAIAAGAFVYMS